jgi:hypothetical protein
MRTDLPINRNPAATYDRNPGGNPSQANTPSNPPPPITWWARRNREWRCDMCLWTVASSLCNARSVNAGIRPPYPPPSHHVSVISSTFFSLISFSPFSPISLRLISLSCVHLALAPPPPPFPPLSDLRIYLTGPIICPSLLESGKLYNISMS